MTQNARQYSPEEMHEAVSKLQHHLSGHLQMPDTPPNSPIRGNEYVLEGTNILDALEMNILQAEEGILAACQLSLAGYPFAVYPVTRSALENAVLAHWVLTAGGPGEMLARHVENEIEELGHHIDKRLTRLKDEDRAPFEDHKGLLEKGFKAKFGHNPKPAPTWANRLKHLGKPSNEKDPQWVTRIWSSASAISHGSGWVRNPLTNRSDEGAYIQDPILANHFILTAAWATGKAHLAHEALTGVRMRDRLPDFTYEAKDLVKETA